MSATPSATVNDRPLFNWLTTRAAGVLLHPTSLPGDQGIGTLDGSALRFLDFLRDAGMSWWQVCPLGPTGYGDSPYQCFSAFAGNPYLVDLRDLVLAADETTLGDIMISPVVAAQENDLRDDLEKMFEKYGFGMIPVVDEQDRLFGVIRYNDIMKGPELNT